MSEVSEVLSWVVYNGNGTRGSATGGGSRGACPSRAQPGPRRAFQTHVAWSPGCGEKLGGTGPTAARLSAPAAPGMQEAVGCSWRVPLPPRPFPAPAPGRGGCPLRHTGRQGLHAAGRTPAELHHQRVLAKLFLPFGGLRMSSAESRAVLILGVVPVCDSTAPPNSRVPPRRCQDNFPPKVKPQLSHSRPSPEENQPEEDTSSGKRTHMVSAGPLKVRPVASTPRQTRGGLRHPSPVVASAIPRQTRRVSYTAWPIVASAERLAGQGCRTGHTSRRLQKCPREAEGKTPTLFSLSLLNACISTFHNVHI